MTKKITEMIIHWNQNPFLTTVELTEKDKRNIRIAYQRDAYVNVLAHLDNYVSGFFKEEFDLDKLKKKLSKWRPICNLTNDSEEILDIIDDLNYPHVGDCTCDAASCSRCYVESLLGIDTTEGCGKHQFRSILGAFCSSAYKLDPTITIDQAIEKLSKPQIYVKSATWPDEVGYEEHIPRWKKEREQAVEWLISYKERHGFL